jgi:hypothetical protein
MKNLNLLSEPTYVKVEDKNRFYFMLQQMQSNRWKITGIVLFLFFFIVFGINVAIMFKIEIAENWKEMLLILLGAFVGNLNKVVDYWFSSEDRDKMLIQKVDEEDGRSLSNLMEYPSTPKQIMESPAVIISQQPQEEESPQPTSYQELESPQEDYPVDDTPSENPDEENPQ